MYEVILIEAWVYGWWQDQSIEQLEKQRKYLMSKWALNNRKALQSYGIADAGVEETRRLTEMASWIRKKRGRRISYTHEILSTRKNPFDANFEDALVRYSVCFERAKDAVEFSLLFY